MRFFFLTCLFIEFCSYHMKLSLRLLIKGEGFFCQNFYLPTESSLSSSFLGFFIFVFRFILFFPSLFLFVVWAPVFVWMALLRMPVSCGQLLFQGVSLEATGQPKKVKSACHHREASWAIHMVNSQCQYLGVFLFSWSCGEKSSKPVPGMYKPDSQHSRSQMKEAGWGSQVKAFTYSLFSVRYLYLLQALLDLAAQTLTISRQSAYSALLRGRRTDSNCSERGRRFQHPKAY